MCAAIAAGLDSSAPGAETDWTGWAHQRKQAQQALKVNPHVPGYLLGVVPFPKRPPEYYGMSDENEAVLYVAEAAETWLAKPEALAWLAEAMLRLTLAPRKPAQPRTGKPKPQGQRGSWERSRPPRKRT